MCSISMHPRNWRNLNYFYFLFYFYFWLQREKKLANICIILSWYLCQAPFSPSALGAGPSQPLRVGLRSFPLGLVSLLHITVLYRHRAFTGVLSDLHQYSEKSQPPSMAQHFLVSWIHRQTAQEWMTCYPPTYLQLDLFSHSEGESDCIQDASRSVTGAAASQTHSQLLLPAGAVELLSRDCCPGPSRMLAAMTQRGSESYSWHPSALGRGGGITLCIKHPI